MKKNLTLILALMFAVGVSPNAFAAEHGGKEHGGHEHGGKEHGGTAKGSPAKKASKPSKQAIRDTMKSYVEAQSAATGTFNIKDPDTGEMLSLEMLRVHERVGKTGDYYYSCADFKDANTGKMYDLDLDVADLGNGQLKVADVRVHKEEGQARYTYDDNDNRVPLKAGTRSHLGKESPKGSPAGYKGSPSHEHGGKEHGGHEHGGKEHGGN